MNCSNCGNPIPDGNKFCGKCGTPVPEERRCPNCGNLVAEGDLFCGKCGTRVDGNVQSSPQPEYQPGSQHTQQPGQNFFDAQPRKYMMVSKYVGEPTVGIAKATGTLCVYPDRLEFAKSMGNALAGNFGLIGMAIAAKKMEKSEGKVDIFYYRDIQNAYVGKYAGLMPTVVVVLNNGQTFSFAGTFTGKSAADIVNTILYNR